MIPVCGSRKASSLADCGFSPDSTTALPEGVAGLSGCSKCPTFVQPVALSDILTDAQNVLNGGSSAIDQASSTLGKSLGNSLGQAVTTAVEANPKTAKEIVSIGALVGVGMVACVGMLGYLIGKNV